MFVLFIKQYKQKVFSYHLSVEFEVKVLSLTCKIWELTTW